MLGGKTAVRYKFWVEHNDALVFGVGRFRLLQDIDRLGSISKAAETNHMSYRAAWGKIRATEERWGVKLVLTTVGGSTGGGAELTDEARGLLERYEGFAAEAESAVEGKFEKFFADLR